LHDGHGRNRGQVPAHNRPNSYIRRLIPAAHDRASPSPRATQRQEFVMRVTARGVRTLLIAAIAAAAGIAATAATGSVQVPPPPSVQAGQSPAQSPTPTPCPVKGTGLLMGQIIDATSRRPVAGATITISGGTPTMVTLPTGEIVSTLNPSGAAGQTDAPRQI